MSEQKRLFIVGAAKSGTTGLFETLRSNDDVFLPLIKEPNYFATPDMTPENFQRIYSHDIQINLSTILKGSSTWHIAHIDREEDYRQLYQDARDSQWLVDASTSYLWSEGAAKRIAEAYPNAKVVILLRHPIDRLISHYLMNVREAKIEYSNILEEVAFDYSKQRKGWGVSHQYVELGLYFNQLKRFEGAFDMDQLFIRPYEYWKSSPDAYLEELAQFLQIPPINRVQSANVSLQPRFPRLNKMLQENGVTHTIKKVLPQKVIQSFKAIYMTPPKELHLSSDDKAALSKYFDDDWGRTMDWLAQHHVFWENYLK